MSEQTTFGSVSYHSVEAAADAVVGCWLEPGSYRATLTAEGDVMIQAPWEHSGTLYTLDELADDITTDWNIHPAIADELPAAIKRYAR